MVARGDEWIRRPALPRLTWPSGRWGSWVLGAQLLPGTSRRHPVIREAGGVVTDFSGRDIGIDQPVVVAGNVLIHCLAPKNLNAD